MAFALRVRTSPVTRLATLLVALAATAVVACSGDNVPPAPAPTSTVATSTPTPKPPPAKVTFMAGFRPQANLPFVAAYVAKEKGFFADENLDVEIKHSSGADEHLKFLLEGSVQFTTATAAQVLRRSGDGLPVVAVALYGQRGDQGYLARADSGIKTPADLKGRTIGFKSGVVPAELDGMLAGAGLKRDDVKLVSVGFDVRAFIEKQVEVYPVFLSNEPFAVRKAGVDVTVLDPADFGVPTLGLTTLVNRETLTKDPALVERYLRATLRAVVWTQAHPDEAVQVVLKYAPGADAAQQRFLLEKDLEAARRADGIGRSSKEQWQALADTLVKYQALPKTPDVTQAFDSRLVDGLYTRGEIK
ncbi:MAG: hypothetical protein EPO16_04845 [Dehalococcoidia bacterium]|nr:MAG: hypothetical protein EPO16_04845 [Dehalococcoidia bacterium]